MTPDPQPEHPQPWRMSDEDARRVAAEAWPDLDEPTNPLAAVHDARDAVEAAVALGKPSAAEPGIPPRADQKAAFDVWADNGPHSHSLREIIVLPTPESDGEFDMTRHEAFAAFRAGVRFARTGSPFKGPAEPGERVHARPSDATLADFDAWWNHRVLSGADGDDDAITLADVRAAWDAASALREQREAGTRTEEESDAEQRA